MDRPIHRLLQCDPMPEAYAGLLSLLLWDSRAIEEKNERTGSRVKVLEGGVSFRLNLEEALPTVGLRRTYPRIAAAETAWYIRGDRSVSWLRKYAKIWDKFVEVDGLTVQSAYGYRWAEHFGRNQLALAVEALRADPTDRRCYVTAWDPAADGLGAKGQKNVPCPIGFNLTVQGGRLHSTLFWRSCDVFVGLPYDVMGHALLMDAVSRSLGLGAPGIMQCSIGHAHLYEAHWSMAHEALGEVLVVPPMAYPGWTLAEVAARSSDYVEHVTSIAGEYSWPAFAPRPEVIL